MNTKKQTRMHFWDIKEYAARTYKNVGLILHHFNDLLPLYYSEFECYQKKNLLSYFFIKISIIFRQARGMMKIKLQNTQNKCRYCKKIELKKFIKSRTGHFLYDVSFSFL